MRFLLLFCLLGASLLSAQVVLPLHHEKTNDEVLWPVIPPTLTYEEYTLLTTRLGFMEMGYAFVVPGYAHFRAQEPVWGYSLLGVRALGIASMISGYYVAKDAASDAHVSTEKALWEGMNNSYNWFATGAGLFVVGYLVDWIHGTSVLEDKQRTIRYRYGLMIGNHFGEQSLYMQVESRF